MTEFKDLFSKQSADYARFRPTYPDELFSYLSGLTQRQDVAWDCATGNGQAALKLAPHFSKVIATDPSEKQLASAVSHPKIEYRVGSAEQSGLADHSVDLVTVAQAFHWFKQDRFFSEVQRVLRPEGVLAFWCYSLCSITPEVDAAVLRFYNDELGPYWEKERLLVDDLYRNVQVSFEEIKAPRFEMTATWSLEHLVGYLGTWSALQTYIKKNGSNPLEMLYPDLKSAWGSQVTRTVRWPIGLRVARCG